jgi:hypothetical protein
MPVTKLTNKNNEIVTLLDSTNELSCTQYNLGLTTLSNTVKRVSKHASNKRNHAVFGVGYVFSLLSKSVVNC